MGVRVPVEDLPDQYKGTVPAEDLPDQYRQTPQAAPEQPKTQADFAVPGGSISPAGLLQVIKHLSNMAIEGGPQALGAAIGGGLGSTLGPAGTIGGAALGAAGAGTIQDLYRQATQGEKPPGLGEATLRRGTDVAMGATQEAAPLVAKAVNEAANLGGKLPPAIPNEVTSLATKGIRPINRKIEFKETLKSAIPDAAQAAETTKQPIESLADLADAVKSAKTKLWSEVKSVQAPFKTDEINASGVGDAMKSVINPRFRQQNPEAVKKIEGLAKQYNRDMSVDEIEKYIEDANNELHSYYSKNKVGRDVAYRDPDVGFKVREVEALRRLQEQALDRLSMANGQVSANLKRRYGALRNVEEEVNRRKIVAERQAPASLSEQVAGWSGGARTIGGLLRGDIVGVAQGLTERQLAKMAKKANTTDELIKRAFSMYNSGKVDLPFDEYLMRMMPVLSKGLSSDRDSSTD